MKKKDKRELLILIGIGLVIVLAWHYWPGKKTKTDDTAQEPTITTVDKKPAADKAPVKSAIKKAAPKPKVTKKKIPVKTPVTKKQKVAVTQAERLYKKGISVFETQPILARTFLSRAFFSDSLTKIQIDESIPRLEWLAGHTLLKPSAIFNPSKDPYTVLYTFQSGEVLEKIERKLKLHIPSQLLMKINGITNANQFQAGRTYKLIRGPFHAIVYKKRFIMDVYLERHEDNMPRIFIKRYRVGLGRQGSTPVGKWRLGCGAKCEKGKAYHPAWNPPPNSGQTERIEYGKPEYPFGDKGLWIGLVGTDENTVKLTDYGIHSTDDQSSIGKNDSLGCIRMGDDDIEEIYSLLYEYWSTVEIVE